MCSCGKGLLEGHCLSTYCVLGTVICDSRRVSELILRIDSPSRCDDDSSRDEETEAQKDWLPPQCVPWASGRFEIGLSGTVKSSLFLLRWKTDMLCGVVFSLCLVGSWWFSRVWCWDRPMAPIPKPLSGLLALFLPVGLPFYLLCIEGVSRKFWYKVFAFKRSLKTTAVWEQ